jgi:hypothetical protein
VTGAGARSRCECRCQVVDYDVERAAEPVIARFASRALAGNVNLGRAIAAGLPRDHGIG